MEPSSDNFTWSEMTYFGEPLTLRDRFAIAALPLVARHNNRFSDIGEACYSLADAMLKAKDAK